MLLVQTLTALGKSKRECGTNLFMHFVDRAVFACHMFYWREQEEC